MRLNIAARGGEPSASLTTKAVKAALTNDQRFFRRLTPAMRSTRFDLENVLDQAQRFKYATGAGVLYDVTFGLVKAQRMKSDPSRRTR
jgi:hypothetical protein